MIETPNRKLLFVLACAMLVVAGCATGPSPTLSRYSDAQIEKCAKSLTQSEEVEAQRNAQARITRTGLIPGGWMVTGLTRSNTEYLYEEYEKICRRKGVL